MVLGLVFGSKYLFLRFFVPSFLLRFAAILLLSAYVCFCSANMDILIDIVS